MGGMLLQIFMQIFLHVTNISCPVIADTQVHGVQYGIRSDPDVVFTLSRGDAVRPCRGDANISRQVWLKGGLLVKNKRHLLFLSLMKSQVFYVICSRKGDKNYINTYFTVFFNLIVSHIGV